MQLHSLQKLLLLLSCVTLGACTTPGQLKDSDFTWSEEDIALPYQRVFRNVKAGNDTCGGLLFDGFIYDDVREAEIMLHNKQLLGGGKAYGVPGKIFIKDVNGITHIRVGVDTLIDRGGVFGIGEKGGLRQTMLRWAKGDVSC